MNSFPKMVDARFAALVLLFILACSPADSQVMASQVTDSAGVAIVTIESSSGSPREDWTVSSIPPLVLGAPESGLELYRVTSVVPLSDGRIALANAGSGQLLVFSEDGELLQSHGRTGEGPGEWKRPFVAGLLGQDTLVVMDSEQRRISFVHAEEGFLTSHRIDDRLRSPASARGISPTVQWWSAAGTPGAPIPEMGLPAATTARSRRIR